MTADEMQRIATLEVKVDGMREDMSEVKEGLAELLHRRADRHAQLEARLAVLEDRSGRLEKLLYGASIAGGGAALGHIPAILQMVNGG